MQNRLLLIALLPTLLSVSSFADDTKSQNQEFNEDPCKKDESFMPFSFQGGFIRPLSPSFWGMKLQGTSFVEMGQKAKLRIDACANADFTVVEARRAVYLDVSTGIKMEFPIEDDADRKALEPYFWNAKYIPLSLALKHPLSDEFLVIEKQDYFQFGIGKKIDDANFQTEGDGKVSYAYSFEAGDILNNPCKEPTEMISNNSFDIGSAHFEGRQCWFVGGDKTRNYYFIDLTITDSDQRIPENARTYKLSDEGMKAVGILSTHHNQADIFAVRLPHASYRMEFLPKLFDDPNPQYHTGIIGKKYTVQYGEEVEKIWEDLSDTRVYW